MLRLIYIKMFAYNFFLCCHDEKRQKKLSKRDLINLNVIMLHIIYIYIYITKNIK